MQFRLLLKGATLLLLAGCLPDLEQNSPQDQRGSNPSPDNEPLTLCTWVYYVPDSVLELYTEETGIAVQLETFYDYRDVRNQLQSRPGEIDVIIIDGGEVQDSLKPLRLIQKIDRSRLPRFSNLDPNLLGPHFDPENEFTLPFSLGFILMAYRKDRINDPGLNWDLLWRKDLKGKIGLYREANDIYSTSLARLGMSPGSRDPLDLQAATNEALLQATELQARYLMIRLSGNALSTGDIWCATAYEGDALSLTYDQADVIGLHVPEKAKYWYLDSVCIARDSDQVDLAHQFIDFLLRPDVAAMCANANGFRSPNLKAQPLLLPELQTHFGTYPTPPNVLDELFPPMKPAARTQMNDGMSQILRAAESNGMLD